MTYKSIPTPSFWHVQNVDTEHKIIYIVDDSDRFGGPSVTNDAENVVNYFAITHGVGWRVVYKDTSGEWWELYWKKTLMGGIEFKRWHGLVWDILTR